MRNIRFVLLALIAFLLLSWGNFSRLCQHFSNGQKFSVTQDVKPLLAYDKPALDASSGWSAEPADTWNEHEILEAPPPAFTPEELERDAQLMASKDTFLKLEWPILSDVRYKRKYHAEYDEYFEYPIFGDKVRALDGKKVEMQGYIIPLGGSAYALSKNPYAACFFCGGAGPETVVGLNFSKTTKRLRVDDYLRVRGIFHLNDTNVEQFMYQINAFEIVQ